MRSLLSMCIAASVVIVPSAARGQATRAPGARLGLIAGVNSASLSGSDASEMNRRTAPIVGATAVLPLAPHLALQPEALFEMKGASVPSADAEGALKLSYLEIPVLLRLDIPTAGSVTPYLHAGPAVAFKTSCNVEASGGGASVSIGCDELVSELGTPEAVTINSVDMGAIIGGGLAFDVGGRVFTIGARYEVGMVDLTSDSELKNHVLSVIASFEWPFHR